MDNQSEKHPSPFYSARIVSGYGKECEQIMYGFKNQVRIVKNAILKSNIRKEAQQRMIESLAGVLQSSYRLIINKSYPLSPSRIQDFLLELMLNCDDYSNWQLYQYLLQNDPELARGIRQNHIFFEDLLGAPKQQLQRLMLKITNMYEIHVIGLCLQYTDPKLKSYLPQFCTSKSRQQLNLVINKHDNSNYDEAIRHQYIILKFILKQLLNGLLYLKDVDK